MGLWKKIKKGGEREKNKAKGTRNPTKNSPTCGSKIDFFGKGGGEII